MNRQIAQLLLLKNTWVLINNQRLVYIHEALFKRDGNKLEFSWNGNSTFNKSCNMDELNDTDFLKDVKLFSRNGILRYFHRMAEYAATIEDQSEPTFYFAYWQYNKKNQEQATTGTKQLIMAKSYNRDILLLNDNANWRVLDIEKGLFRMPLHQNSPAYKFATSEYDWAETEGESENQTGNFLTNEKCVSVRLPPGFVTRMQEMSTVEYFESIEDFFSKDSGLGGQ